MNKRLPAGRRVFCGTEGEELQELEEGYRKIVSIAIAVEKGDRAERPPFLFVRIGLWFQFQLVTNRSARSRTPIRGPVSFFSETATTLDGQRVNCP